VGSLLGVRAQDLSPHDVLSECGFDEVLRAQLGSELAQSHGLDSDELPASADTAAELTAHLITRDRPMLQEQYDGAEPAAVSVSAQPPALADIAYTLQVGREDMPHRVAVVTGSLEEAARRLRAFAAGNASDAGTLTGTVDPGRRADGTPRADDTSVEGMARAWTAGAQVNWPALHSSHRRRVPLVGYPFARERHWLDVQTEPPSLTLPTSAGPRAPEETETPVNSTTRPDDDPAQPSSQDTHQWLERTLISFAADAIGLAPERMDARAGLGDYGFESVALKVLAERISGHLGVALSPTVFYERQGLAGVTDWLMEEYGDRIAAQADSTPPVQPPRAAEFVVPSVERDAPSAAPGNSAEPIAVIGMSGRFPGAADLTQYWDST
jgi:acyl transferase domain-containing protein